MRLSAPGWALLALPLLACSGEIEDDFLGDHSFRITESCPQGTICFSGGPTISGGPVNCIDTTPEQVCENSIPPNGGGCWITGIGYIIDADGHDNFGGNGMPMKDGRIRGEWEHVDHGTGDKFHGQVDYLFCRHVPEPGPGQPSGPSHMFDINQAYYGGPGRWFVPGTGWSDGYWFDVMAEDHGEPGNKAGPGNHGSMGPDFYHFTARQFTNGMQSGTPVMIYDTAGDIVGGNFQIHPPNNGHPFTSSNVPPWVDPNQP